MAPKRKSDVLEVGSPLEELHESTSTTKQNAHPTVQATKKARVSDASEFSKGLDQISKPTTWKDVVLPGEDEVRIHPCDLFCYLIFPSLGDRSRIVRQALRNCHEVD